MCRQQLATEMSKAGTNAKLTFGGNFFDRDAGVNLRPLGLFEENESGKPVAVADVLLGGGPINPDVCRAAFGMLGDSGAVDAGAAGASVGGAGGSGAGGAGSAPDATTGGAAGGGPAPTDDGGCSASGRGTSRVGFAAFAAIAAAVVMGRRRSRG